MRCAKNVTIRPETPLPHKRAILPKTPLAQRNYSVEGVHNLRNSRRAEVFVFLQRAAWRSPLPNEVHYHLPFRPAAHSFHRPGGGGFPRGKRHAARGDRPGRKAAAHNAVGGV